MKVFVLALLAAVAVVSYAQKPNPIPIPSFNLSKIEGQWYGIFDYDANINNEKLSWTCWSINIHVDGNDIHITQTTKINGKKATHTSTGIVSTKTSIWQIDGEDWAWISLDPISQSWGTIGSLNNQSCFMIARKEKLDFDITQTQYQLARAEGYLINATNTVSIAGKC